MSWSDSVGLCPTSTNTYPSFHPLSCFDSDAVSACRSFAPCRPPAEAKGQGGSPGQELARGSALPLTPPINPTTAHVFRCARPRGVGAAPSPLSDLNTCAHGSSGQTVVQTVDQTFATPCSTHHWSQHEGNSPKGANDTQELLAFVCPTHLWC